MVKYKSINKNNVYKKNRRSKKLRKQIQKGAAAAAAATTVYRISDEKKGYFLLFLLYLGFRVGLKSDGLTPLEDNNFCLNVDSKHDKLPHNLANTLEEDPSLKAMGVCDSNVLVNYIHIFKNTTVTPNVWEFDYTLSSGDKDYTDFIESNLQGLGTTTAAATQHDAGKREPAPPTTHNIPSRQVLDTDGTMSSLINTATSSKDLTIPYYESGAVFNYPATATPGYAAHNLDPSVVNAYIQIPMQEYWELMMIFIKSLVVCGHPETVKAAAAAAAAAVAVGPSSPDADENLQACKLLSSLPCRWMSKPSRIELEVPPKNGIWHSMTGEDNLSQSLLAPYVGGNGRSSKSSSSQLLVALEAWMNTLITSSGIKVKVFRILKFMGDNQYIFDALIRIWATGKEEIIRTLDRPLAGRVQNVIQSISDNTPETFAVLYDVFIQLLVKETMFDKVYDAAVATATTAGVLVLDAVKAMISTNFDKKLWLYVSHNYEQHNVFMDDPKYIDLENKIPNKIRCKDIIRIVGVGNKISTYKAAIAREIDMIDEYSKTVWNYQDFDYTDTAKFSKDVVINKFVAEYTQYATHINENKDLIRIQDEDKQETYFKALVESFTYGGFPGSLPQTLQNSALKQINSRNNLSNFSDYEKLIRYTKIFKTLHDLENKTGLFRTDFTPQSPAERPVLLQSYDLSTSSRLPRGVDSRNPYFTWQVSSTTQVININSMGPPQAPKISLPQIKTSKNTPKNSTGNNIIFDFYTSLVDELNKLGVEENYGGKLIVSVLGGSTDQHVQNMVTHLYILITNFVEFFNMEMIKLILNGGLSSVDPKSIDSLYSTGGTGNNSAEAKQMATDGTQPNVLVNNYARIKKRFVDGKLFYGQTISNVHDVEHQSNSDKKKKANAEARYKYSTDELDKAKKELSVSGISKDDKKKVRTKIEKFKRDQKSAAEEKKLYSSVNLDKNYNIFEITAIIFMRSKTTQIGLLSDLLYLRPNLNTFEKRYVSKMVKMYATFVKFIQNDRFGALLDTTLIRPPEKLILGGNLVDPNFYNTINIQLGVNTTFSDTNTTRKYLDYGDGAVGDGAVAGFYSLCWFDSSNGQLIESVLNDDGSLNKNFYAGHVIDG
jgi:hypothetical protein